MRGIAGGEKHEKGNGSWALGETDWGGGGFGWISRRHLLVIFSIDFRHLRLLLPHFLSTPLSQSANHSPQNPHFQQQIMFFWQSFFVLFPLFAISLASYCGKSGVPYSLEVLPNGAPVLGCAQPSCVISALDADGDFQEDSQFLTDGGGQSDGFFRDGDRALKRFRHGTAPKLIANCSGQFNELSCPRRNQWVGGIEYIDHPRQPLILQCCTFEGLRFSQEVGSTSIGPGEAITGGEVVRGGRQISFDVIANVVKKVAKQENNSGGNKITYEVTVRRMNCLPDPPEPEVELDSSVPAEVAKVLSSAKNKEVTDKFKDAAGAGGKQPAAKKQRPEKQKAKQQFGQRNDQIMLDSFRAAPIQQELPEISGGEGDRPSAAQNNNQLQSTKNNEAVIQAGNPSRQQNEQQLPQTNQQQFGQSQGQQQGAPQFIPQQSVQQQQSLPSEQQFPQQAQQFVAPGQFPTLSPNAQEFQQQIGGQSQQFQQQIQNAGGESVGIVPPADNQNQQFAPSSTVHPLFGSFHTLPPHSFPTFPPHTFPTLPTHSFPTLPTHSFPTLPPHTFPTFAPHTFPTFGGIFGTTPAPATFSGNGGFQQPSGTGSESQSAAFAAPSVSASANGPIPLGQSAQSSFLSNGQSAQQQYQNPHSPFRRENNALPTGHHAAPKMAPAMGTILAAMQGQRYPVMHPILGLIGYSNSAPTGK